MKYTITWNSGYGESEEIVEADSIEEAERMAYDSCREEFEYSSTYKAVEYTEELEEDSNE